MSISMRMSAAYLKEKRILEDSLDWFQQIGT